MQELYLLALGFVVGLSGAMIPGPLLVYTIAESLRKGWKTGFYVIVGHAFVEIMIMALLLAGVSVLMTSEMFVRTVSIFGGGFMLYTAYGLVETRWDVNRRYSVKYGTITGGVLFTALNPSFPVWWATAGARLLLEGIKEAGVAGAFLVFIGHWGADLGYFTLVSALTAKGRQAIIGKYVNNVKNFLAALLVIIGLYFIHSGI